MRDAYEIIGIGAAQGTSGANFYDIVVLIRVRPRSLLTPPRKLPDRYQFYALETSESDAVGLVRHVMTFGSRFHITAKALETAAKTAGFRSPILIAALLRAEFIARVNLYQGDELVDPIH